MKTDNELIAEFMGFEVAERMPISKKAIYMQPYVDTSLGNPYFGPHRSEQMRFDSSWDWLMPVVEKIETLHDASYLCRIVSRRCIIYDSNIANQATIYQGSGEGIISSSVNQDSKLIATYKTVVYFIKWHNEQSGNKA